MKVIYKLLMVQLLFSAIAGSALSQQQLTGTVFNERQQPISGATVRLEPSGKITVTSVTGSFAIGMSAGDTKLTVTNVGYEPNTVVLNGLLQLQIQLKEDATRLEDVVLVGTRSAQRSKYNSIAPVDVIKLSSVQLQMPQIGMNELLSQLVPSFNANRQSASDGTEHIDPASLRGLGPDQVLVLINGKRRHTTSLINYQNTVGNGAVGTDLNSIPVSAIDRIEVLRDGAAAQYGSDAIAGVINIILKKNTGFTATASAGQSSRGDGGLFDFGANYGVALSKDKGFLNLTFEANRRNATNRARRHDLILFDQSANGDFFAYPFANDAAVSRAFDDSVLAARGLKRDDFNFHVGDAKVINYQAFVNSAYQLNANTELYLSGGASLRNGTGFGFRRLPSETDNVVLSLFPNGFQPTLNSSISDYSFSAGIRRKLGAWKFDLSNTFGRNEFIYTVKNTNNASMGANSPTTFKAGSHSFLQNTINADVNRSFTKGATTVGVAFGGEFRTENYRIKKGQDESWKRYADNPDGKEGAQSFAGFSALNEVNASRHSVAGYADVDFNFNKKLLLDAAIRFENYSDFGSTLNGKLGARYNLSKSIALRGTVSTGFRAPSLHQQYFSYFYSDIDQSGSGIVTKGIFPINSAVAKAVGLPALKKETSVSYSAGVTFRPDENFALTIDGYLINIKDRIVITSEITDSAFIAPLNIEGGRFFTNAINTRTKGIDLVATYTFKFAPASKLEVSLASNFNKTAITAFNFPASLANIPKDSYFGPDQQSLIETNNPVHKHTLTLSQTVGKFNFLVRNIYWGKVTRNGFPFGIVQEHKAKVTSDFAISCQLNKAISFAIGGNNVLDVFPDLQAYENSYFGVFKYAPVQQGTLGAFYYARVNVKL